MMSSEKFSTFLPRGHCRIKSHNFRPWKNNWIFIWSIHQNLLCWKHHRARENVEKMRKTLIYLWFLIWFECLLWLIVCTNTRRIIQIFKKSLIALRLHYLGLVTITKLNFKTDVECICRKEFWESGISVIA